VSETQTASRHSTPTHRQAATAAASPAGNTAENQSAASQPPANDATVKHHTVKPGDTLYSIAKSYKTTVQALERDNKNVAILRPGMILVIRDAH
jgi:membrane-bound lytic murein transglycosylase D